MTLDVPLLRADTPGVANVLHFNNAGAALPPRPVLDAVMSHLAREAAIGGYEAAAEAEGRIADVYNAIAALIAPGRDRVRGKRHARLGHGVLGGSVPGGRPRNHRADRVRVELSRVPADEGARRDRDRHSRGRRVWAARPRGTRARNRSAYKLIAITHVEPQHLMAAVVPDAVLGAGFAWVCQRRRDRPADADIWSFRHNWLEIGGYECRPGCLPAGSASDCCNG